MGNEFLKIFAVGNLSFTGIVNHTLEDLRRGKNPGRAAKRCKASRQSRLARFPKVVREVADVTIHNRFQEGGLGSLPRIATCKAAIGFVNHSMAASDSGNHCSGVPEARTRPGSSKGE
jgi:hypothetical protein